MSLEDRIMKEMQDLSESKKAEVLDFVEYLKTKVGDRDWSVFSLSSAMRDREDESSPRSLGDLKEAFQRLPKATQSFFDLHKQTCRKTS